ncbi:peptidase E, partial [bacterium]
LGKPIAECDALCIPTGMYAIPNGLEYGWDFVSGREPNCPMCELGWKSMGLLELSALPSLPRELWVPRLEKIDALLVSGGDALYLYHWMLQSGVAEMIPSLPAVYLGMSAGSMVTTPAIGAYFGGWTPPGGEPGQGDRTLGLVDFSIFPHVDHPALPGNTMAHAERWAATLATPSYAVDDETAIQVVDGTVEIVSEGRWKRFDP